MSIAIYAKDLVKRYGKRTVVNHVSFEVQQGEIVGLLGPNGAGKTTSFYQVVGLVRPDEGHVYLQEEDITALPMYKRAKMGIGYLPQEASVFRKLSVEDNISAVLEMTSLSKAEQRERLESLLDEFRLHHVRKSNGDVLSGGERRRTEIARALAVSPKFILLDEPFAGIDPIAVEDIQAIVARLKYKNIGILITDHNVTETLSICDRAYLLIDGKIFQQGTAEALAADEQVKKLYLGRNFELKRKDYLHEEAFKATTAGRQATELNPEKVISSVENALAMISQIQDRGLSVQDFADPESFGLKELSNFLPELKASLLQYAGKKDIGELKSAASTLPLVDLSRYRPVKTGKAAGDDTPTDFDGSVIDQLKEDLHEIAGNLRQIIVIVQNTAKAAG
ncbi:LPS export ABC transporter ATP-binding protein [Terrimonas sp. NA20]|uniref:LPS export ABC transporter ATP-binding protein n=1 Tax=Terrimonas ginsenosidimutans TaxID=2908004 RepID=A0ABS9KUS8_9BACT|nr:LPS export ABC transporter ATP-binding protein [Terrimonas ginsenosidimutans]